MKICFCLHNHQPVGNFDHVMDSAYEDCYLPMLEALENHQGISSGIHISGTLLEWLAVNHPDYIERTGELCRRGRMELLTSGRYEPILTIFRRLDVVQQIKDYSDCLAQLSGRRPGGLWLTERVWEPQLPSILSEAGVSWAVVDDIHLKRAGVLGMDLFRPCITEDSGRILKLLGSNRELRYRIPFSPVESVMEKLREMHDAGASLVFYGDDGEKFGVWPGTNKLCYEDNWLDRFLGEVESADWLDSVLPSEAAGTEAAGPFYIPASSYTEMGEWTLHGRQRDEYDELHEQLDTQGRSGSAEVFLTGGFWRNFLSVYPESKELHGRILCAEPLVRRSENKEALHHFWRSQCNCAFWHGVFGGIYLPHLREAVWKELHKAEWKALKAVDGYPLVLTADVNADGFNENIIVSQTQSLLIHPDRGLTISELTFLHPDGEPVPLGHVLSRQLENYHKSIPGAGSSGEVRTIHDDTASKEEGLAGKVTIDRWRRMCFSDLVMSSSLHLNRWKQNDRAITHFQKPALSTSIAITDSAVSFSGEFAEGKIRIKKKMTAEMKRAVIRTRTEYSVEPFDRAGMEICLNLMTGQSPDRYYRVDSGEKHLMSEEGEFHGKRIEVFDCWRKVKTIIEMSCEADVWVTPLDSVNRSESGYERVHQGAAFYISGNADDTGFFNLEIGMRMEALNDS
ncbi:MAG: DUF1926 domain-containing protein [Candidatus Aegiribacteria sp.]|nr:DUF1926 domain-containing protein [Candidatus Aegiribacteria sp.]